MRDFQEDKQIFLSIIEAVLFAGEAPIFVSKIQEILGDVKPQEISKLIESLNEQYRSTGRSFEIRQIAGGYQMFTLPEFSTYVEKLNQAKQKSRLSQRALETMAIIAYKQPITKHEIEEIRGVNVDGVVKTLLSRNLITISGRAKAPGGPFLYTTTRKFLDYFGLNALNDLPKLKEIDELVDVDEDGIEHHEIIFKEIHLDELGLKSEESNNVDGSEKNLNGKKEDSS